MKITIKKTDSGDAGSVTLPKQFTEPLREDLITRAVLALQAAARQPYGGYGGAGMRHSAELSRRRRKYRGSYGAGISRVPRKILTRRGTRMYWVGALVAGAVGGRRAHGPKPFKDWTQKVNKTERRKAIRSALAATMDAELVSIRGHKVPKDFPFILDNSFEKLTKTKDLEAALVKLGFDEELVRGANRRIRAGKGTMRGRKYKQPVSFLFVTGSNDVDLVKSSSNIPGSDIVAVHELNAELLAPGTHPGRLTLFTQSAIERLEKEGLFTRSYVAPEEAEPKVKKPKKVEKKTMKKAAKKTAKKTVKKVAKKTSKKKSSRATKKATKEPVKKAVKKTAKKVAA